MKVGIDIDGVLADFVSPYQQLHVELTGRNDFLPGDNVDPPTWNWPGLRGYTPAETSLVWERIKESPDFWRRLLPIASSTKALALAYQRIIDNHDLYFITTRVGKMVKQQTESWLVNWVVGIDKPSPTVLLAQYRKKGQLALGLGLDCYIDDNYDNCTDVVRESPRTRTYLVHRRYNEKGVQATDQPQSANIWYTNSTVEERRVPSFVDFLHVEGLAATLKESLSH